MKKTLIFLFICNFCTLNAQNNIDIPPGAIQLNDSIFIDISPVTNYMFTEYLTAKKVLRNKGYESFGEFVKKTNEKGFPIEMRIIAPHLLIDFYSDNKFLTSNEYGLIYKFQNHPVLNASKKQAIDYCKWRTEMVSHLWKYDEKHMSNKNLSNKINCRLATENELILAKTFFTNSNKIGEFNEKILTVKQEKFATQFTIFPVNEMTASEKLFNNKSNFEFTGFRCICEMGK
ncbi:MAG: SUMF1/EgtB/PvdO family nonheme iron enzyme [Flavobacterium sp.]|nr:SUMF1/EgtB/PvdO family nonheme iron enzyme [Flavobacterium sp.]